jgi:hypothetical protein
MVCDFNRLKLLFRLHPDAWTRKQLFHLSDGGAIPFDGELIFESFEVAFVSVAGDVEKRANC